MVPYLLMTDKELELEKSLLQMCKTLTLFFIKYSLLNRNNLTQKIQIQLPQKQRILLKFLLKYLKSILNFEHSERKKILIADVFPKLRALENGIR